VADLGVSAAFVALAGFAAAFEKACMMPELAPRFRAGAAFLAVSEEAFPLVS
jgi:hypothetical protein